MKRFFALMLCCPLVAIAADDAGIESLDTIADLGDLCEYYTPNGGVQRFSSATQAYRAGLCVGFVKAEVGNWLRVKYKDCGTTPGASLGPVFAALRKTYRLRTLRDPDQKTMWFARSAANLLQEAVFTEWDEKLIASDCPRLSIDDLLASKTVDD